MDDTNYYRLGSAPRAPRDVGPTMTVLGLKFEAAAAALIGTKRARLGSCLGTATDGPICPIGPAGERSLGGCVLDPLGPQARN